MHPRRFVWVWLIIALTLVGLLALAMLSDSAAAQDDPPAPTGGEVAFDTTFDALGADFMRWLATADWARKISLRQHAIHTPLRTAIQTRCLRQCPFNLLTFLNARRHDRACQVVRGPYSPPSTPSCTRRVSNAMLIVSSPTVPATSATCPARV